jgi:hypothetical protein
VPPSAKSLPLAILAAGAIIGALDAIAAIAHAYGLRGTPPGAVWRYVASAVFGDAARTGGGEMVVWGLLLHLVVATAWTGFFFLVYPRLHAAEAHTFLTGMAYGLFVWLMMNLVVVPLTRARMAPLRPTLATALMILIHLFVIGVPIAYLARRHYAAAESLGSQRP